MTDLDLFRNVNNTLGHLAGDEVLQAVAQVMKKTLRKDDVIGRFGGEEFVILLRDTDDPGAARAAERVRAAVQSSAVKVTDSPDPVHITMSLGVAAFPSPCPDTRNLMRLADLAVYRSKLNGRNQVTMATPDMAEENPASDQSYHAILKSLAFAVNTRGAVVGEHILRITSMTLATARELGVEEGSAEWRSIEQAGLLHDVGNLAISSTVLYKNGPLSDEEWEEMQMHPEIGWSMLHQVELLKPAAEIVRAHHEHYDGSGYPRGLSVDDIPLGARILAVVDAFDAITSGRPYRAARPEPEALQEIVRNRGTQFDPRVIDAFLRALGGEQVPAAVRPAALSRVRLSETVVDLT
jgi:diguanylate cyclase (GGDEF)-like protein